MDDNLQKLIDAFKNSQNPYQYDPNAGFWSNYTTGWKNQLVTNPLMPLQGIGNFWSNLQNYRQQRDIFNLQKQAFNQQMQLAQANEDRTKQRFEWLKQARAGSSL